MIEIDFHTEPPFLSSATVVNTLDKIRRRPSHSIEKKEELWRNEKVTDKLHFSHHGKCCYCERRRDRKSEMDVEHYRPKGAVKDEVGHEGYWWLAYEWNNALWSCKTCNQRYKGTIFTLLPNATRAFGEADDLNKENPCLINPKHEDPSQYLTFHIEHSGGRCYITALPRAGIGKDEKKRASETVRIAGLNRDMPGYNLIEERGSEFSSSTFQIIVYDIIRYEDMKNRDPEKRQHFIDAINELRKRLKRFICSDRIFAGVYRDYLRQNNIEYASLLEQ